jgi:Na+-driven multidrug efflux pump
MILMVGVNIINIVLNPILIFGLGGIPAFGIAGSALATILSRGAGLVAGMFLLVHYSSHISFPKTYILDLQLIWRILTVAIPNSIQSGLRSGTFLVMMAFVAAYGTAAISGYGIAERLELIALMPGFAIATATDNVDGYLGAKKPDRAEEGLNSGVFSERDVRVSFYCVCLSLIWFLIQAPVFTQCPTWTVAPFYIIMAVSIVLSFAMNGAGDTKKPMYATLVSMVIIQIPLGYYLPQHFGLGITGIWIAIIIGIIIQAVLLTMMYKNGSWKRVALEITSE